jgi:hypothetical protein
VIANRSAARGYLTRSGHARDVFVYYVCKHTSNTQLSCSHITRRIPTAPGKNIMVFRGLPQCAGVFLVVTRNGVCAFAAIVSAAIAAVAAAAALGLQLLWPSVPVAAPSPRALHATWPRGPPHGARDRKRSREKLVGMRRVIKKASDCRRFKALISYQVRLCVRYLQ